MADSLADSTGKTAFPAWMFFYAQKQASYIADGGSDDNHHTRRARRCFDSAHLAAPNWRSSPQSPVMVEISGNTLIVRSQAQPAGYDVEVYTPERKAELLLNNAVDRADYVQTLDVVRAMELDPSAIPHERPAGA